MTTNVKRIIYILITTVILLTILSSCSNNKETTNYDVVSFITDDNTFTEIVKADDGNVVLSVMVSYPIITDGGNSSVIEKLNNEFQEAAEYEFNQILELYSDEALEMYNNGYSTTGYEFTTRWEIQSWVDNMISIIFTHYQYTGGAHGGTYQDSYTYNIETGDLLSAEDIIGGTHDEVIAKVKQLFIDKINESPDDYNYNAIDSVNAADDIKFYLYDDAHLAFYFNEYEIAPYVAGIQTVLMNFSEN